MAVVVPAVSVLLALEVVAFQVDPELALHPVLLQAAMRNLPKCKHISTNDHLSYKVDVPMWSGAVTDEPKEEPPQ